MINTQCTLSGKLETVPTKQTDLGLQGLLLSIVRILHVTQWCIILKAWGSLLKKEIKIEAIEQSGETQGFKKDEEAKQMQKKPAWVYESTWE